MRGRTPWLHTSGCLEQRVASFHVFMPGSNPLFYQFVANPARLASPRSCYPPKLRTPLCHHNRDWNLSLALQRGVSWGAALISHPWQSMTFWWDHEYPVMHCLRHSVLELCGWSSKQQFYFLLCWLTSNLWTRWWPSRWVGVLLRSASSLVDEMGRGETQSPFPHTVMLLGLLKLLTDPSQPPVLILGNRATPPSETNVATPEDEDSVYRQVLSCWFVPFWSYYSSFPVPFSQVGPRY